jgi:hypothetical protein
MNRRAVHIVVIMKVGVRVHGIARSRSSPSQVLYQQHIGNGHSRQTHMKFACNLPLRAVKLFSAIQCAVWLDFLGSRIDASTEIPSTTAITTKVIQVGTS